MKKWNERGLSEREELLPVPVKAPRSSHDVEKGCSAADGFCQCTQAHMSRAKATRFPLKSACVLHACKCRQTVAVQEDWANRDFVQSVQLGVANLATFLNEFGASAASRACVRKFLR